MGCARRGERLIDEGVTLHSETGLVHERAYLSTLDAGRTAFTSIYAASTVLELGARSQHCDVEICAYPQKGPCGRYRALNMHQPPKTTSPNWSNGIPRRQESSPEEAPSFCSRPTRVRSIAGELYFLKRCVATTIECLHLLANAADR